MAPVIHDIKYYRGDTYSLLLFPKTAAGTPFDLSEFTLATFDIADKRGDDPTRQKFRINATIDGTEDTVLCVLDPASGNLLDASKVYYYDVTVSGPATHTFVTGTITISESVVGA